MECPCGRLGWKNALVADLDGMPLWRHGADLDGMPLQRTWMGCPCGGLGLDALVAALGGLGWNALVADLDWMPLVAYHWDGIGRHTIGMTWGGIALWWHTIGMA